MIKWDFTYDRPSFRRQAALAGYELKHTTIYIEKYVNTLWEMFFLDIIKKDEIENCLKRIKEKLNEDLREIK